MISETDFVLVDVILAKRSIIPFLYSRRFAKIMESKTRVNKLELQCFM